MVKLLFVQLPPPRFNFEDPGANIPLAAGFLDSCIKLQKCFGFETEILSPDVVDVLADLGIISEICRRSPDILAMTLYLWNSQRSLFIASAVKRLLPDVKVIVGGPEITPDNGWVLAHPAIDMGVFGEGEPQLVEALKTIVSAQRKRSFRIAPCETEQIIFNPKNIALKEWDLGDSGYPYVDGTIGEAKNGSIFLETARGCPFKCKYCYYHKTFDSVRSYPLSLVERVLDFAYSPETNVSEIYLMDPTFNARIGFRDILKSMATRRANKNIKIHAELRADLLNEEDIKLFKDAGLVSAEIGLQTVNRDALELAGRDGDSEKVLAKAGELTKTGVYVTTGIILGLPGDTPEGFSNTLNRLKETQAFSVIQPFTLAILPGTDFRRESCRLGLQYDDRPPYYLKSSDTFSAESMKECLDEFEETFEMELDCVGLPSLVDSGANVMTCVDQTSYLSKWIVRLPGMNMDSYIETIMERATNPFTIWFKGSDATLYEKLMIEVVSNFLARNPHTFLSIVFEFDIAVPRKLLSGLLEATASPEIYINKAFFPLYSEDEVISPNFIVVAPLLETNYARNSVIEHYLQYGTIVWSVDLSKIVGPKKAITPLLISGKIPLDPSLRSSLGKDIREKAGSRPEEILFRNNDYQAWWNYQIIGLQEKSRLEEKILTT